MSLYKFELNFKDDNVLIQIDEPFQFDAFTQTVEKKSDGFACDVYLFAENSKLLFTNQYFKKSEQYEDIDGIICFYLSHGLKRIIDAYNEYGSDANVEFRVYYKNNLITKCDLDFEGIDSDLLTYLECGCIENSVRSKHKLREEDVIINMYASENLDGEPIEQLQPVNILLQSVPKKAVSKWLKTDIYYDGAPNNVSNKFPAGTYAYFNFCRNPITYEISDTLVPSPFDNTNSQMDTYNGVMKIIDSKSTKSSVSINILSDITVTHKYNGRTGYQNKSSLTLKCRVSYGTTSVESTIYNIWYVEFLGTSTQSATVPEEINFDLPIPLRDGEFLTVWWEYFFTSSTTALSSDYGSIDDYSNIVFNDCTIEISAIETFINSVVQGNRWIDILKKSSEIISGLEVDAPMIDVGGEYYDTMCINGAGIRNISGIDFNVKTKDIFETGLMVALDYLITEENIKIGSYSDFHANKLLRTFDIKPDNKFTWDTNTEYRIKTFDYKFKTYEQDRDEQNTLDAVHTEAQFIEPNLKTTNKKEIKINQILDQYKIDSLRKLGVNPETKDSSLEDDTSLIFLSVVDLEVDSIETYTGSLYISTTATGIKIVSKNFRWDKLGMSLTSSFSILSGANIGLYSIDSIESTLLTLTKISGVTNVTKDEIITFSYSLSNVFFKARTNENFDLIEGVISPNTFLNLIFSIKRNMRDWLSFLATCGMRFENKSIVNTFFKSNGNLITRLNTESVNVVDNADITIESISNLKKVTDRKFKIDIFPKSNYEILNIFSELNVRNTDGSIGGYYGFIDINGSIIYGYPIKMEYIVKENKIEGVFSEKYINELFELNDSDRLLYSHFETFGIYVSLYNFDGALIFNKKRFNKIKINGVKYSDYEIFLEKMYEYFS